MGACVAHALDILHNDLKLLYRNLMPENIMVLDNGYVTLMDYRLARPDLGACRTLCGSPSYFSPEMVRGEVQGPLCDFWGLGVLLFELSDGELPWGSQANDDMTVLRRIAAHQFGALRLPARVTLSSVPQLMSVLNQLLHPEASQRLCGLRGREPQLRTHPFFAEVSWPKLLDSELPSPLRDMALDQFTSKMEDIDWEPAEPVAWSPGPGDETAWLEGYTV